MIGENTKRKKGEEGDRETEGEQKKVNEEERHPEENMHGDGKLDQSQKPTLRHYEDKFFISQLKNHLSRKNPVWRREHT